MTYRTKHSLLALRAATTGTSVRRRDVLRTMVAVTAAGIAPGISLAATGGEQRFVLIILRGALDGLALAPPYGDGHYRRVRDTLAFESPGQSGGVLKLDGLFGLHPSMANVHGWYRASDAMVLHAVASPYRARSHFDGQDILESGSATSLIARDGWLNRALSIAAPAPSAMALASTVPYVLRGSQPVSSWAPSRLPDADEDTLRRLGQLYGEDEFFAAQFDEAMAAEAIAQRAGGDTKRKRGNSFRDTMKKTAAFLTAPDGARVAVVDTDGWDTHAGQGVATGGLANRLRALDDGLGDLKTGLGANWNNTVVAVVTEFGRTVRPNGTRGTDHGTGTAALLVGGAVEGGRVIADWPGLREADLYQNRDLAPTRDLRSVFKSVLVGHLGLDAAAVSSTVFPDSGPAPIEDWFS